MVFSDEHSPKAISPIFFTPLGMMIDSRLVQLLKTPLLRLLRLLDNKTVFNFEHSLNPFIPMLVTLSDIVMLVRFLHLANAATPICVTLVGIVNSEIEQLLNAQSSILVIVRGISTDIKGHDSKIP